MLKWSIAALALLAALALTSCGSDERPNPAPGTIVLREYEIAPKSLTVARGAVLTIRNEGQIAHNLTIEHTQAPLDKPDKLIGTDTFLGGRSKRLAIDLAPGRYTMICSVPGHRQLGMYGSLTVR